MSLASNMNNAMDDNLNINEIPEFTEFLTKSNSSNIFLEDCSPSEVADIIKNLESSKASDIPINIVKKHPIL